MRNSFILLLSIILAMACTSDKKSSQKASRSSLPEANNDFFQDITDYSGIDFIHSIGDDHLSNIVESVGGGAAFLDFDQDGWMVHLSWSMGLQFQ